MAISIHLLHRLTILCDHRRLLYLSCQGGMALMLVRAWCDDAYLFNAHPLVQIKNRYFFQEHPTF